jgi:hypothetical protein
LVLLPEGWILTEVGLRFISKLIDSLFALWGAGEQLLVDGEVVAGEVVAALLGVTEHVEHVATGATQGESRREHAEGEDGVSEALLDDGLHAILIRAVVTQTPQDRPHFQCRTLLILKHSLCMLGQLLPL